MDKYKTYEPQNQWQYDEYLEKGSIQFGAWTSSSFRSDPKRICMQFSRYKFCAKMLRGKTRVLEVGCGDAPGVPMMLQFVNSVVGVDIEKALIEDNTLRFKKENIDRCKFLTHDIIKGPVDEKFNGVYSLDVLEHIPKKYENKFMENIVSSLTPHAVCVIGSPNITAREYANPSAKKGHVNLKSAETLEELLTKFFHNVFIFSMNDEIVHMGFYPMAHYLIGVGIDPK